MKNTLDRIFAAINSIGIAYVAITIASILQIVVDVLVWPNSSPNIDHSSVTSMILVIGWSLMMYDMWNLSASPYRTPITMFILVDAILTISDSRLFSPNTYLAFNILRLVGVYIIYTGPTMREVIREFRASAYRQT